MVSVPAIIEIKNYTSNFIINILVAVMTVISYNARHTGEGQYPFFKGEIPAKKRHPSVGWGPLFITRCWGKEIPAFAGMTVGVL